LIIQQIYKPEDVIQEEKSKLNKIKFLESAIVTEAEDQECTEFYIKESRKLVNKEIK
jgi:hypothetical protein